MLDSGHCHLETYAPVTQTAYVTGAMVFDISSMSRIAYITITIFGEDSTNPCLFQQCTSAINDLAYITGSLPQDGSTLNLR